MMITMKSVAAPATTSATARPGQGAKYSSNAPQAPQEAATAPRDVNLYEAITFLSLAKVLEIAAAAAPVQ